MTLENLISDIESTFSNFSETGDIDRVTIKSTVIKCLRGFGKNICQTNETIVEVKNSKALLPESFKSLILALKLEDNIEHHHKPKPNLHLLRQYVENPVIWDVVNNEYIINDCESKLVTESINLNTETNYKYYYPQWLTLSKAVQKDTLDVDCLNLHPSIRNNYADNISITNRTLNANFTDGKVYLKYNSLPADEDGEVIIPVFTTGDIENYVINQVKLAIAEPIIINSKNPQGIMQLYSSWKQEDRLLKIKADSEANWNGMPKNFNSKLLAKNIKDRERYNLPQINRR